MTEIPSKYSKFFRPGDFLTLGIHLPDRGFAEDAAKVVLSDDNGMLLKLCSRGFPPALQISSGTRGVVTRSEGRIVYYCRTVLMKEVKDRYVKLHLVEAPQIKERRQYARKDVEIFMQYSLPTSQNMRQVLEEWEELKSCSDCYSESESVTAWNQDSARGGSLTRVNLSGSGLRFKISDCLSYGTLLHLRVGIPGEKGEHAHAIGAIVRTRDLLTEMEQIQYYSTSMSFRMIDSHDRKRVLEYVLDAQRKAIL